MNVYELSDLGALLRANTYPGRGIVAGMTADGKKAAAAYFIMGRSENSRNRIFAEKDGDVFTRAFDESKVKDPSLIIYRAVHQEPDFLAVTNGDQTDTICDGIKAGKCMMKSLSGRTFEPDAPNFTPRVSALFHFGEEFSYQMSILKSADEAGTGCNRFLFNYAPVPGVGHFLHTYVCDGSPIPSFCGEPERVAVGSDLDGFTELIWNNLNEANKISLYVRFVDLATGKTENRLVNKNR